MKLLLLGGPRFLGRAITEAALERGHELTFFNRGTTNPELYPEVERIVGDRKEGLDALAGRSWDAVVDTCGYLPRDVQASSAALTESSLYCFVSSISVYADFRTPVDEDSPLAELGDQRDDDVTNESYGALKALCESAVRATFAERALVVRPGLIVGPHDPTGRFTYWPHRVARGGEVLAPGPPERPTQVIDVRDLAEWTVALCEERRTRYLQRHASGSHVLEASRDLSRRHFERRTSDVGHGRLPRRARSRRMDGASALARRPCARGGRSRGRGSSRRRRPRIPPVGGNGSARRWRMR